MDGILNAGTQTSFVHNIQTVKSEGIRQQNKAEVSVDHISREQDRDVYLHEEETISVGLYQVIQDEEGKPKIIFDGTQKKAMESDKSSNGKKNQQAEDKITDSQDDKTLCKANTDKVDNEIKELKERKAELEQKVSQAKDDPKEQEKLKEELQAVVNELRMKGNDSYRRQNTEFTNI